VGDNRFAPDDTCTRAQMAAFLFRMAGGRAVIGTSVFTDVSPDAYYAEAVQWAVENGITRGTGDGTTFSPDETCTRGQMVTVLYRFFVK
ncbi:MAG: S-layer homology domain-containing protein, partial [Eubacteriales bacterium]